MLQIQPRFQPMYINQLNNLTNTSLKQIHATYYPDLTDEEFALSKENQNKVLFERGKLLQLAKYGSNVNCEQTYNQIRNNPDFKELSASKYYNSPDGFIGLVNTMDSLSKQRQEKLAMYGYSSPYYLPIYPKPISYEKYNTNDYLKLLNNFTKNEHLSDDLKQYFLSMKADKLDVYYTRLDKLQNNKEDLKILTQQLYYSLD